MSPEAWALDRFADRHQKCSFQVAVASVFAVVPMARAYTSLRSPGTPGSLLLADGTPVPPSQAWFTMGVAAGAMLGVWVLAWALHRAGRYLRERTHYRFCLVMAAVSCASILLFPLGLLTLVELTNKRAKALFAPASASPGPAVPLRPGSM